jgi:hypothetical protein
MRNNPILRNDPLGDTVRQNGFTYLKPDYLKTIKNGLIALYADVIGIREIARRIGISRNGVKKYLHLLKSDSDNLSGKELVDKAYNSEVLEKNTQRL